MIFARRQIAAIAAEGLQVETFYLSSRTNAVTIWTEGRRLRQAMTALKPHLLHAQFGTVTAALCALSARVPLVITYRGSDLNPVPSMNQVRVLMGHLLSQLAALRARRIVCVSSQLRSRLWWRRTRISVVPSGVDLKVFREEPRREARAKLGWSTTQKVVLFNAGAEPAVKRLDLAQEAVMQAARIDPDIAIHVIRGRVVPADVNTLLNAADCLLVTSDWEGSPNIVKEALACGTPIVSVDVGDVRERVFGVEPSRLVSRDPAAIAGAIAEILHTPLRSNGREHVAAISLQETVRKIIVIYNQAARFGRPNP
jgi:teichuronic acid biosynthesis glycosyltransferase TuaC